MTTHPNEVHITPEDILSPVTVDVIRQKLQLALAPLAAKQIIFSLKPQEILEPSGLQLLLGLWMSCQEKQCTLAVEVASKQQQQLLAQFHLADLLAIREAALHE